MPRKRKRKAQPTKKVGIEALVKSGYDALYIRGAWMKKLKHLDKGKREPTKR